MPHQGHNTVKYWMWHTDTFVEMTMFKKALVCKCCMWALKTLKLFNVVHCCKVVLTLLKTLLETLLLF